LADGDCIRNIFHGEGVPGDILHAVKISPDTSGDHKHIIFQTAGISGDDFINWINPPNPALYPQIAAA
jgi:hypothetical protein